MVVGQDVAFGADDDATAHAAAGRVVLGLFKKTKPGLCASGFGLCLLLNRDAHHGRRGFLGGLSEATAGRRACAAVQNGLRE
jgi:hypothetical protein